MILPRSRSDVSVTRQLWRSVGFAGFGILGSEWRVENGNSSFSQFFSASNTTFPSSFILKRLENNFNAFGNNYGCSTNEFASLICDSSSEWMDAARGIYVQIS